MKTCTKCGVEYPDTPAHFSWRDSRRLLRRTDCRLCRNQATQDRYRANPAKHIAESRAYRAAHPRPSSVVPLVVGEFRECTTCKRSLRLNGIWFIPRPERIRSWRTQCRDCRLVKARATRARRAVARGKTTDRSPGYDVLRSHRNWAHKQGMRGVPPTADATAYIKVLALDPCSYCGQRFERLGIDHIVPVASGGTSVVENLTAACASCNSRKNTRSLLQFLAEVGARYGASDGGVRVRTGQKT